MADRTLYDVLEVSATASPERIIRAAYDRLSVKFDPGRSENAANTGASMQYDPVKEAFLILGNPDKRKLYDLKLLRSPSVLQNVEPVEPFWTLPRMRVAAIVLVAVAGFYFSHQNEQTRLVKVEAEKTIAVATAKEVEEQTSSLAEREAKIFGGQAKISGLGPSQRVDLAMSEGK